MRFKTRITTYSILLAIIPMMVASIIIGELSYESGQASLNKEVQNNLESRRNLKKAEVEGYIQTIENQVISQAVSTMFVDASKAFIPAFNNYLIETASNEVDNQQKLARYYEQDFHKTYQEKNNGNSLNINQLKQSISPTGLALQGAYIGDNPNALGSKDALNQYEDGSTYSVTHQYYHPGIRSFLSAFGYYDIFIVEPNNGQIVYSVFKEMDYATSLVSGPYRESGLANAYKLGKNLTHGTAAFTQFEPYTPSYESAASFVASPIMENGKLLAVLIFQMPVDALNAIMTFSGKWRENNMGESAEIYLVDKSKHILNDSRFYAEDSNAFIDTLTKSGFETDTINNIKNKGTTIGLMPVKSPGIESALKGSTGFDIFNDYRNIPVASAYGPINAGNLGWIILSEIDVSEAYASIEELKTSIITSVVSFSIIALILSIAIGWHLARKVTIPIETVSSAVEAIAENQDLSLSVPTAGDKEIQTLGASVNSLVNSLRSSIDQVKQTADGLRTSSQSMAKMSNEMSSSIQHQEKECALVATSVTQLHGTAEEVASNANNTADETQQAKNVASESFNIVSRSSQASIKLADELTIGKDILSQVAKESEQISAVLDVINGIAEQTNLLALNAAIEAARAGEQGRGFAVVADEVRQLAQRTQSATTEIEQMISNLQSSSGKAVEAIDKGNDMADESVEFSKSIDESIHKVTDIVSKISDMNLQIATASAEQTSVVSEMNNSVNNINTAAGNNAQQAEQLTEMAEKLQGVSNSLHDSINRYTL